ncbi:MAG: OmpA family protein, partial [Candidatus Kapaibacteriota bacterium]
SVYKYLSSKTGGNFYHFPWKLSEIGKSLVEVIFSSKYYFGAKIKFSRKELKCKDLDIIASVSFGNISFSDEHSFPIQDRTFYTNYQAVSLFEHSDTTIKDVFLPTIDNLANLLITHRNLTLELIGTASIGESYSDPIKLSLERALAVQKRLVSKGVYPSQIRTKGIGISKPIYPNEDDENSSLFNRRVEIRWLLPEILPFTIVVDTVSSEEQAERKVEFWEKLGYKSYYDRLFSRNQMMYKVVLWGYRTYEEAERDAIRVSRKFKKNAIVE